MAEDHHTHSPFTCPPEGSELKRIVDELEAVAQTGDLPDTLLGCVELWADELTIRRLVQAGMPAELAANPAPWLRDLLSLEADLLRTAVRKRQTEIARGRRGRPAYPNRLAALMGLIEHCRQRDASPASTSENAVNAATAAALGPGIARDHVFRLMRYWRRELGRLKATEPLKFELAFAAIGTLWHQIDDFRRERPRVRAKSRLARGF